jgi:hypothetical protein
MPENHLPQERLRKPAGCNIEAVFKAHDHVWFTTPQILVEIAVRLPDWLKLQRLSVEKIKLRTLRI